MNRKTAYFNSELTRLVERYSIDDELKVPSDILAINISAYLDSIKVASNFNDSNDKPKSFPFIDKRTKEEIKKFSTERIIIETTLERKLSDFEWIDYITKRFVYSENLNAL